MTNPHAGETFPGFPPEPVTNYWPYPKALNGWWKAMSPTEQKVLDYILRHTWGFNKTSDAISLSQFIHGITKRDGTILDGGTGIKNEKTVSKALKGLECKKFIISIPTVGGVTTFQLQINPSQEMGGVPKNGTTLPPKNSSLPSQTLVSTIKNTTIKDNNTSKTEIQILVECLSQKLGGVSFPNYGKQAKFAKSMLDARYSVEDIKWAIDRMYENPWWQQNSFDLKNVADEIPKLMTRTVKREGK